MAVVYDLAPEGAIDSYSDLVAELRDLQDNAAYDSAAIARAVRKAEAYFIRRLRSSAREVSATLAVTGATAALPADCREIRAVVWLGSDVERPLAQMSLAALSASYGGLTASCPQAYAREGDTLRFAPVASGTARLVYFGQLISLSDANPSNWLLQAAPDLYIAGSQYYLCRRERDDAGATAAMAEADAIIAAINDEAASKAGGNLIPYAITQVCGSRV